MATRPHYQRSSEELVIYFGILAFWPAYLIGGLYVLGSVIGWALLALTLLRRFVQGNERFYRTPVLSYVWIVAMALMLVALIIGHAQWALGLPKTIKSSIGWAKGWALLALFIYVGATLKFDHRLLINAVCKTSALAIPFFVLGTLLYGIGGPQSLFVSPLKAVGGPGPEFFELRFFGLNPETGRPRWFFFTPWAPAAGLVSCLFVVLCAQESNLKWRLLGCLGCMLICLASQSRAGMAIFFGILPALWFVRVIGFGYTLLMASLMLPVFGLLALPAIEWLMDGFQSVKDARPGSTRVRSALADIAVQRWASEAPVWGHGIVERGPKVVEHMPIGTHHSWYGLLFTKGMVGALSLAIPMVLTGLYLVVESFRSRIAFAALSIVLVLGLYSFFENLEILVYLYWPALLYLGVALNHENTSCSSKKEDTSSDYLHCRSGTAVAI